MWNYVTFSVKIFVLDNSIKSGVARRTIMEDYSELWNKYAIEFNNKLESDNGGDWNKIDEIEQEIAALWKLAADMYWGGFDSFFLMWGYDCYSYAMRGIERIAKANSGHKRTGCNRIYKLFDKAYKKVFSRFENDDRIKSGEDLVKSLTLKDIIILKFTYVAFDKRLGPLLCQRAYEFYCEKLKKTL